MQAYRESIGSDQDVLVLQPDSEFFKFLQSQAGSTAELSRAVSLNGNDGGLGLWPGRIFLRVWLST